MAYVGLWSELSSAEASDRLGPSPSGRTRELFALMSPISQRAGRASSSCFSRPSNLVSATMSVNKKARGSSCNSSSSFSKPRQAPHQSWHLLRCLATRPRAPRAIRTSQTRATMIPKRFVTRPMAVSFCGAAAIPAPKSRWPVQRINLRALAVLDVARSAVSNSKARSRTLACLRNN